MIHVHVYTYRVDLITQQLARVRAQRESEGRKNLSAQRGATRQLVFICGSLLYKNQPAPRPPKAPIKGVFHTLRESHARGCNPAGIMLTSPLPVGVVNTRSRMGARRQWRRRAKRDGGDDGLACGLVIVAQRDAP